MNAINAIRSKYEELRILNFGDFVGGFIEFGDPLEHPGRILTFKNFTDAIITISFDGETDHEILAANSFDKTDHTSNASSQGGFLGIAANTQIYADGAPTTGFVALSVVYGSID